MFELFDQFLYIAILMFGAYITLYIKSRSYSGILLIVCSILSNILLFSVVLDPFIFITLPITAVLLLRDFFDDYREGVVSRKHKLGAMLGIIIIAYDIIFIIKLSTFHLLQSYGLFTIGSILGTITGFYLVIYPLKEMMHEREVNLRKMESQDIDQLEANTELIEDREAMDLHSVLEGETITSNQASNSGRAQETRVKSPNKIFGIDSLYLIVGAIVGFIFIGSMVYDFATRRVIDMQDYVFVTTEPGPRGTAKVGYYAAFEHLDKNNFYDELIAQGQDYGLSDEEIEKYTPVYTTDNKKMFSKLDIKVANNMETVKNGDIVTTNITYNENYALKNNIVIKNSNFETEIDMLPIYYSDIDEIDAEQANDLAVEQILDSKYGEKYKLDGEPEVDYVMDGDFVSIIVSFDNQDPGILGQGKKVVSFKLTPYSKAGTLYMEDEIEIVNRDKFTSS